MHTGSTSDISQAMTASDLEIGLSPILQTLEALQITAFPAAPSNKSTSPIRCFYRGYRPQSTIKFENSYPKQAVSWWETSLISGLWQYLLRRELRIHSI